MEKVVEVGADQLVRAEPEDFTDVVPAQAWQALYNRLKYGRKKHKGEKPQPLSVRVAHIKGHIRALEAQEWLTASGQDSHLAAIQADAALGIRDCDENPKLRDL